MQSAFNKKLKNYLQVYKTPIAPDSLDPSVFYFPETGEQPRLLPGVEAHILNDMEQFSPQLPSRIGHCLMAGPVTVPGNKNRTAPIDVFIVLSKGLLDLDLNGLVAEEMLRLAKALSGKCAVGTTRPIQYTLRARDIDPSDFEGIFDVYTRSWKKLPSGVK